MLDEATALHLANRLGFGPAPGELDSIGKAGFDGYLEEQLNPEPKRLPPPLQAQLNGLPSFGKNTFQLYREYWWRSLAPRGSGQKLPKQEKKLLKMVTGQVGPRNRIARLARAIASPHRLREALTDFWFNNFNIYEKKGLCKIWTGAYEEEAIRPHLLGKFSDLLLATAKHPAMLVYLDNSRNVAPGLGLRRGKLNGINENYAREVMELHTLGVNGGYTQKDVISLAHILTGWTVGEKSGTGQRPDTGWGEVRRLRGGFAFDPEWHDSTPQTLLGRRFANAGESDGEAALLMLARHPATARHISFQIAQYFVADKPPAQLVDDMASTFRSTDGDIRAVSRAMFTSKAFRDPANFGQKFKTPYQYVVSAARVAALDPHYAAPLAEELKGLGQPLYECVTPDGYACTEAAWLDPDAMMRRISFAVKFGSGAYAQPYLAHAGYGSMNKHIRLQPEGGGTPLDAGSLLASVGGELSDRTRAAVAAAAKSDRAGMILGSPEFMRC